MIDLTNSTYVPSHIILEQQGRLGALHLGDINAAMDLDALKQNNILTVITAANNLDQINYPPNTIRHIIYPLMDIKSQKISKYFNEVFDVIEEGRLRGGLLVHCAAGVSRSATLVIAYIMRKEGWGFKRAIELVRGKRKIVCPNLGFEMQLKEYQKQCANIDKMALNKPSASRIYDSLRKLNRKAEGGEYNPRTKQRMILKFRKMSNFGKKFVGKAFNTQQRLNQQRLNLVNNFIVIPLKLKQQSANQIKCEEEKNPGRAEFRVKPKTSSYPVRHHNKLL